MIGRKSGQKEKRTNEQMIAMNMIWSVSAVLINYFMQFLITPYVTNNIGVEAYGFVSLATSFTSYIDIAAAALNTFAGRFISVAYHRRDLERANRFYSSVIAADLILAVCILLPGAVAIRHLESFIVIPQKLCRDVKILFVLVLINYLLTLLRTAFNTAAFIANRLDLAERTKSVSYVLQAVVLLGLCLVLPPHVWYVGIAYLCASFFLLVRYVSLTGRLTPELHFSRKQCSLSAVHELLVSGVWNALNNLGDVLNSGLDLLITDLMLNAVVLGEISIVKNLGMFCYALVKRISESFQPRQLILYAQKDTEGQVKLFRMTMKATGMFCSLIICVFWVCGRDFIALWLPEQNTEFIYRLLMIVLFSDVAIGVVNPLYYVFTLTKKLKIPCLITIAMGAANVLAMYVLLVQTRYGAYAVVITTLVINGVHFIDTPLYASYCLGVRAGTFYSVIVRHVLSCAAGTAAAIFLEKILPAARDWIWLVLKGAVSAAGCGAVILAVMLRPGETKVFWKKIRKQENAL